MESPPPVITRRAAIGAFVLNTASQTLIAAVGFVYIFIADASSILWLVAWVVLATVYAVVVVTVLGRASHRSAHHEPPPPQVQLSRFARILGTVLTYVTSLVGLSAAVQVIVFRDHPSLGLFYNVIGATAMILAWGFLHWGFAQLYLQHYYRTKPRPLRFPETPNPSLVDFAYFSYTIGTSFAASDVEIRTTRARWRVLWHSIVSFFFNSLIIVLAMNIIISADFSDLF